MIHETQTIRRRMLEHITFYAERNASARIYVKLKLYASGRRSTSRTTFEARPLENMIGHDYNDANPVSERITDRNAANYHAILQMTPITLRYV
ncbi:hypothetical protein HanRHA438_Chr03g0112801 [Helianthus annuus]|nr:hypothetical protein HanRHA438_Chr03g0112801 [Helianthus annuus]